MTQITLQRIFPAEWREGMPRSLVDLVSAEYDELDEVARDLRAMAVDLVHSFEREPVLTAESAMRLLEKHHLPARAGKWTVVALNKDLERVYTKSSTGGMRLLHWTSKFLPKPEHIQEYVPLPPEGSYLLLYGGSPDVLSDTRAHDKVTQLRTESRVADVVLWDESDGTASFWSVRAKAGQRGSEPLTYPDPSIVERWWPV